MQPSAKLIGPSIMGEQRFGRGFFNWIARQLSRPGTAKAFPDTADLNRRRQWILTDLDLEPILIKAIDTEEGHGWTFDFACRMAQEYRRFLVLCLEHPSAPIVPSSLMDDFWHLHILDTQKHIKDAANLREAWLETLALYQSTFGMAAPKHLWSHSTAASTAAAVTGTCRMRILPMASLMANAQGSLIWG